MLDIPVLRQWSLPPDRMDSFVLAETFKYLYLLFAKPSDLIIDLDQFIFTTEAHLLPLSLARLSNLTVVPVSFWASMACKEFLGIVSGWLLCIN